MYNRSGPPGGRPGYSGDYRPRPSYVASPEYLKLGYFDAKGNLRPELLTGEADKVAAEFIQSGLSYGQLRKFYDKAKSIEMQLGRDPAEKEDRFREHLWRVAALSADAAGAVGRGVASECLKSFIDKNVAEASKSEKHFAVGFIQHFQSVLAYFTYRQKAPSGDAHRGG
ncbi:MAG: type III-A CRISPR-associated protein Csm2 [Chloroflexi bacterium]|nr:type III-A CRISPR-associated protein Csm2 [Chloroflexota bacterium]